MPDLAAASPLSHLVLPPMPEIVPDVGVTLVDRRGVALALLLARKGRASELAAMLGMGVEPGRSSAIEGATALPVAPGQWMLIAEWGRDGSFARSLAARVAGLGHVSDQSQGRVVIRISGAKARDALTKECTLDLHPGAATPGYCAQTVMAEVGVLIHQIDDRPSYDLACFSGFALHLWNRLVDCAAEHGVAGFSSLPTDGAAVS